MKAFGGGEKHFIYFAKALANKYGQADFFINQDVSVEEIEDRFSIDLCNVNIEVIKPKPTLFKGLDASLRTQKYDLFIHYASSSSHLITSLSSKSILFVTTPFQLEANGNAIFKRLKKRVRKYQYRSFHKVVVGSYFMKHHVDKSWGVDSCVIYPPVDIGAFDVGEKKNIILSAGRILKGKHDKKYSLLIEAFKKILAKNPGLDWEFHILGIVSADEESKQYYEDLITMAQGYPIFIHKNVPFKELAHAFSTGSIFWHGTGFGEDEIHYPDHFDSFALVVAEAMSSGCVPVVIGKGGPAEIVSNGKNGLLWNTLEELIDCTNTLIFNNDIREKLSRNAILRSKDFSIENFYKNSFSFINHFID